MLSRRFGPFAEREFKDTVVYGVMNPSASAPVAVPEETQPLRRIQWAQALVLVALYSFPAILCLHAMPVADPDVWWHLRTGQWILQHGAVPRTEPFTSFAAGKPWVAYSWLFELLIFEAFQRLGLIGIVLFAAAMASCIAVFLHRLVRHLQGDFSFAVLLTVLAGYAMAHLYTPRPWLISILFYVLELDILLQARKTGKMRPLLWLPVLFALWANVHIEFIDGLVVLAIAATESLLASRWPAIQTRLRSRWLLAIFLASIAATLANPYGWKVYQSAYDLVSQSGVLDKITELQAMPFRSLPDWLVLLLALAAACALARARHFAFFETILLAFALVVSFRSQRDVWVVVIAACAILASRLQGNPENRMRLTARFAPFIALAAALTVFLGCRMLRVNNNSLRAALARVMPVQAVEAVKAQGRGGPLYNDYNWGGYLIWSLRLPVSIDGRAALDGTPRIDRSVATWGGQPNWASDPDLQKARLVIGPVTAPLTQLLRLDPHFQLVYEDKVAAVFAARQSSPPGSAPAAAVLRRLPPPA